MSITQDQIQKIAEKLSKIPWDNEKLLENITDILSYMEMLDEVDTQWVTPTISVIQNGQPLRDDTVIVCDTTPDELLEATNQKVVAHQIILPNIMK